MFAGRHVPCSWRLQADMSQAVLDELLQPDMHVPFFPDVSHVAVWAKRFFVLGEVFLLRMAKRPWGEMEAHVKEEPEAPHVEPPEVASGHDASDGHGDRDDSGNFRNGPGGVGGGDGEALM